MGIVRLGLKKGRYYVPLSRCGLLKREVLNSTCDLHVCLPTQDHLPSFTLWRGERSRQVGVKGELGHSE